MNFGNAIASSPLGQALQQFSGSPFGQRLLSDFPIRQNTQPGVTIPVGEAPSPPATGPTPFAGSMRGRLTPEERQARLAAISPEDRAARRERFQNFWENGPPPPFLNLLQGLFSRMPPQLFDRISDWRSDFLADHPDYQSPAWINGLFGAQPAAGNPPAGVAFSNWSRGWGRRLSDDPASRRSNFGNSVGV